ncbi:MAG: glycosyltransferase family 4 protein, partial [Crenarchaeota archaeon]|nr:glycosyltransferase family 4 protein [Thermoproteota archaeon]
FLAKPSDIEEMCRNINELIENPDLCQRLGRNGRERVIKLYTIKICAEVHQSAYIKALNVFQEKKKKHEILE